jgi:ribosome recycling factor
MNLPDFSKVINHLKDEFAGLQIGRASAGLVEGLMVETYGSMQPLKAIASVSVPDARTIQIQPWDRGVLSVVEKAIRESDLNLNPSNNGLAIILSIPPLTEERRRDLVKVVGRMAEDARISVRNLRHDAMGVYKRQEHDGDMSEDERKRAEKVLQEKVDAVNLEINDLAKKKEEAIMTV